MTKALVVLAVLALAGSALAGGYSIGYKQLDLPVNVYSQSMSTDLMHMLRLGFSASPDFRIEILLGYDHVSWEDNDPAATITESNGTNFAFGGSAFYVIANPANTVFSIGGSFVYNKVTGEIQNVDIDETSAYSIYPIMRVDFAIPGADRFALFTEFGARYTSANTDYSAGEQSFSDFSTWGSDNVLGGAYYSF